MLKGNIIDCGDKITYTSFPFEFIHVSKSLIFSPITVSKHTRQNKIYKHISQDKVQWTLHDKQSMKQGNKISACNPVPNALYHN